MKKTITVLLVITVLGFILPESHHMPVKGATEKDWNEKSFWYYPWGKSRVHKGIDIFAKAGTEVVAPTGGFVLFSGKIAMGGNIVYMVGPKWRFHYFAHLQENARKPFGFVDAGQKLGTVGSSGNAQGKSPHLHYSIKSYYPNFWKYQSDSINRWERLFYVDPGEYLLAGAK